MDCVFKPAEQPDFPIFEGASAKLAVNGQNMTVLYSTWAPGAASTPHTHPHEQIVFCLKGRTTFTIAGEEHLVRAGEFLKVPSGLEHVQINDGREEAVFAEFFSPVRQDLLQGVFNPAVAGGRD